MIIRLESDNIYTRNEELGYTASSHYVLYIHRETSHEGVISWYWNAYENYDTYRLDMSKHLSGNNSEIFSLDLLPDYIVGIAKMIVPDLSDELREDY